MRQIETFYCPKLGGPTAKCDRESCTYSPCGFKRTGYHTSAEKLNVYTSICEFLNMNPEYASLRTFGASYKVAPKGRKGVCGCSECALFEKVSQELDLNIIYNTHSRDNVALIENL